MSKNNPKPRNQKLNAKPRAIIYARYSSDNQNPKSAEDQIAELMQVAERNGFEVPANGTFVDEGISGTSDDRPGYLALKERIKQGDVQVVLVEDHSRFSRNSPELTLLLRLLRRHRVRVFSSQRGEIPTGHGSDIIWMVEGYRAEAYISDLSDKTKRGQMGAFRRGYSLGDLVYGYGSRPIFEEGSTNARARQKQAGHEIYIVEEEAVVVRRIFNDYLAGLSPANIAGRLNQEGIASPSAKGKPWIPATIRSMLGNTKYIGTWTRGKTERIWDPSGAGRRIAVDTSPDKWVSCDFPDKAIVDRDTWDRVQARMLVLSDINQRTHLKQSLQYEPEGTSYSSQYARSMLGGVLQCGECSGPMDIVSGKAGGYYGCRNAAKKTGKCTNTKLVAREKLEAGLLRVLAAEVLQPDIAKALQTEIHKELETQRGLAPDALKLIERSLQKVEGKIIGLVDTLANGIRSDAIATRLAELEEQKKRLQAEREKQARAARTTVRLLPGQTALKGYLASAKALILKRTPEAAQAIRALIPQIIMKPLVSTQSRDTRYEVKINGITVPILVDPESDIGSTAYNWWRRGESNPRPKSRHE